eukprot:6374177-Prymnesium_polylepis.2
MYACEVPEHTRHSRAAWLRCSPCRRPPTSSLAPSYHSAAPTYSRLSLSAFAEGSPSPSSRSDPPSLLGPAAARTRSSPALRAAAAGRRARLARAASCAPSSTEASTARGHIGPTGCSTAACPPARPPPSSSASRCGCRATSSARWTSTFSSSSLSPSKTSRSSFLGSARCEPRAPPPSSSWASIAG